MKASERNPGKRPVEAPRPDWKGTLLLSAAALLLQACGAVNSGLFHGDRVTVDRDFIYLDDPVFLQSKSVYGERLPGCFAFRLPVFFNAGKEDTLRFGPGSVGVASSAPASRAAAERDPGRPIEGPWAVCRVDTGAALAEPAAVKALFLDSTRSLTISPRHAGSTRVDLNFYCKDYEPRRGRTDTLSLAFLKKRGAAEFQNVAFSLPFHVSYRGPVVSILVGLGLLYLFTQLGWLISES